MFCFHVSAQKATLLKKQGGIKEKIRLPNLRQVIQYESLLRSEHSEDLHFFNVPLDRGYAQFSLLWKMLSLKNDLIFMKLGGNDPDIYVQGTCSQFCNRLPGG